MTDTPLHEQQAAREAAQRHISHHMYSPSLSGNFLASQAEARGQSQRQYLDDLRHKPASVPESERMEAKGHLDNVAASRSSRVAKMTAAGAPGAAIEINRQQAEQALITSASLGRTLSNHVAFGSFFNRNDIKVADLQAARRTPVDGRLDRRYMPDARQAEGRELSSAMTAHKAAVREDVKARNRDELTLATASVQTARASGDKAAIDSAERSKIEAFGRFANDRLLELSEHRDRTEMLASKSEIRGEHEQSRTLRSAAARFEDKRQDFGAKAVAGLERMQELGLQEGSQDRASLASREIADIKSAVRVGQDRSDQERSQQIAQTSSPSMRR